MPRLTRTALWFVAGLLAMASAVGSSVDTAYSLAFSGGATAMGLACWAMGGAVFSGRPPAERLGFVPSGLPPSVLAGLVLGLLATSQLAEWMISLAGYREVGNLAHFRRVLGGVRAAPDLLGISVGLALLPGIGEELALRGWVQRGLEPRAGRPAAVLVTALVFGLLHGEPVHAAGAFLLGLYLGTIVALCGSIRPAILCHVVNNLVATVGTALGLEALGGGIALLGLVAGPWALWRTGLARRAAHRPLGETPEAPGVPPPD